ncbi:hypothetical protein W97_03485 [Coniosporium apollinis CBS 100218]|uniref:Uncharacterized protein n=1 Tax=Coniosporium apollinis (strain CBS 100218) TaxID=1168221 RepID=R7YR25_CONA1|nr:uncharacterized protein W97_03485 [Coniosporium apollinis CBS 100218]EON64254.1 hypothetical protein W97_03485 [Coniosporium apollinis CBS 100218]
MKDGLILPTPEGNRSSRETRIKSQQLYMVSTVQALHPPLQAVPFVRSTVLDPTLALDLLLHAFLLRSRSPNHSIHTTAPSDGPLRSSKATWRMPIIFFTHRSKYRENKKAASANKKEGIDLTFRAYDLHEAKAKTAAKRPKPSGRRSVPEASSSSQQLFHEPEEDEE